MVALGGQKRRDIFGTLGQEDGAEAVLIDLPRLLAGRARPLPICLAVVLENLLRHGGAEQDRMAEALIGWTAQTPELSVLLAPSRVILPDSSGLPALMDLAAARDALVARGLDPAAVEPGRPVDLIIDHSLIVDRHGSADALAWNTAREIDRNAERYAFFKWAQQAFASLRVVPPGMGIIHQIHLEHLARVVEQVPRPGGLPLVGPEFVLGCDSHTTMVNALGLLAWGVGGIEAEAALLGEPYMMRIARVLGVRLEGRLRPGVTATDLVLTLTERLRGVGVTGDFLEFFGPGVAALDIPDRATIANMAPEYGASLSFFPIDGRTIAYLAQTGRDPAHVRLVESYARRAGLFAEPSQPRPDYSAVIEVDLAGIEPSLAGPRRPQDRRSLGAVAGHFRAALAAPVSGGGFGLAADEPGRSVTLVQDGAERRLTHGALAIAAITSCTNTSNPGLMIGAGLLARNAVARGLRTTPGVKTSLAPGSRLVADYLRDAGLMAPLETLGFHLVGFACTTCSGKSGPIDPALEAAARDAGLVLAAVLSGNRNFEGRIHRACRANYLASPALVVAYAIAGRIDIDLAREPLGRDGQGAPVFLSDIWPAEDEIAALAGASLTPAQVRRSYAGLADGTAEWQALEAPQGPLFAWDPGSEYIRRPPFFDGADGGPGDALTGARALGVFGDALTTDHITPSGEILPDSEAGAYLIGRGVRPRDFNAVTQRRGNHEFMARVTFASQRIRNELAGGIEGGWTRLAEEDEPLPIHRAAALCRARGIPLLVLAGRNYGMGSSRDWAAKGPRLLGVRAVLAVSFERIHRANLIGMGILPLTFEPGETVRSLGLTGFERFDITGLHAAIRDGQAAAVRATTPTGEVTAFRVRVDLSNGHERDLILSGGFFARVLSGLTARAAAMGEPAR